MCGLCGAVLTAKPCDIDAAADLSGDVFSVAIPGNASTTATLAVGSTIAGSLDFQGDTDWYRITLDADETIEVALKGIGATGLADPYLRVRDASGNVVAFNDDSGGTLDSRVTYTAGTAGTYFIEADSYLSYYTGTYQLDVVEAEPVTLLDSIRGSNRLDDSQTVSVYFAQGGETYTENFGNGPQTLTATGFNAYEREQLFSIFQHIETFADIDFEITTNRSAASLEVASTDLSGAISGGTLLGYFYFPSSSGAGGSGVLNDAYPGWSASEGGGLDAGGFMYGVSIHEFGHGLGLGHPHDTGNGSEVMNGLGSSASLGPYGLNQSVYTAMSYNDGWPTSPNGGPPTFDYGYSQTFGALDIAVLQEYYGANTTHASGNDVYVLDGTNDAGTGYATIWDTGGVDTIRFDGPNAATIDLRAATLEYEIGGGGFMSWVSGVHAGLTIANGVEIENAVSGAGQDSLTGNDLANELRSGGGNDTLDGGSGDDRLNGGAGGDLIEGGAGYDYAFYDGSDAGVTVNLVTNGNTGGFAEGDVLSGIEALGGSALDDHLTGDAADNGIWGYAGNDSLFGGAGNDRLSGGIGEDFLDGGDGLDFADYSSSAESVYVNLSFGAGLADVGRSGDAAGDTLTSIEGVIGTAHNDILGGTAGVNYLWGGGGRDWIYAGQGNDIVAGNGGTDIFVFRNGHGNDRVHDFEIGVDTLRIEFTGLAFEDLTISTDYYGYALVDFGGGTISLRNIDASQVTADMFEFYD